MSNFATRDGTTSYRERFNYLPDSHFHNFQGLTLSSIGLGTYLGNPDDTTDQKYTAAIKLAVSLGCNVIDSAINYRFQRSERSIGKAISLLLTNNFKRSEIFLSTKGGFLSFDTKGEIHPREWFKNEFVSRNLCKPEELVASCHCISPGYIKAEIEQSLKNLGVKGIDLYYLHNPEIQLMEVNKSEFEERLKLAFSALEESVSEKKIQFYGIATWEGLLVDSKSKEFVSLEDIVKLAKEIAGENHHFKAIQLPYSLATPDAFLKTNQPQEGKLFSAINLASNLGLGVFCSASLMQGQIIGYLTDSLRQKFQEKLKTDAQLGLQFVRSTPGVTTALVGMKQLEHVKENLATANIETMNTKNFNEIFE